MSFRSLIRLLVLALVCLPLSVPLWNVAGLWPLLVGPGLLLLVLGYLVLTAGGPPLTRWQLRYYLPSQASSDEKPAEEGLDRLEDTLNFLAARSGHLVLEGNAEGLFLELPEAFDQYIEAQLPRALPEMRLLRDNNNRKNAAEGTFLLSAGSPCSEALRWATEASDRQVRVHIHHGPHVTPTAQSNGSRPPGRWLRIPVPRLLRKLWHRLPVWDELSAGVELSSLLPPTDDGVVYSSRSRLLSLKPSEDYHATENGRALGRSLDGRPLTLNHTIPLFSVGAPASFLASQIADDLQRGGTVIVVSPDRRFLDMVRHQVGGAAIVQRLDPQNSQASARLGIVAVGEWAKQDTEMVIRLAQTFLQDLGLDVDLPAIQNFTQRLVHVLTGFSREAGRDLAFSDLYAISQSAQALQAFLVDLDRLRYDNDPLTGQYVQELLQQMGGDEGYVQAVTILSAIRTALTPLRSGPLHTLCQGPFFSANGASPGGARLLLVPMTNVDFPEHDRLLSAMLDLTLNRTLRGAAEGRAHSVATARDDLHVALHLHDPHLYRNDSGQRWIDVARQDPRLSLLLNVKDPETYTQVQEEGQEGEIIFQCSESLASALIGDWNLPASITELQELPSGVAIARLADMLVALEVEK